MVECFNMILFSKEKSDNFKDKKYVELSKASEAGTLNLAMMYRLIKYIISSSLIFHNGITSTHQVK